MQVSHTTFTDVSCILKWQNFWHYTGK